MNPGVVHIVESLAIGGLERLVYDFVVGRKGGPTSVVCLESIGSFGEDLAAKGYSVTCLDWRRGRIATVKALRRYLREKKPDVIHCHNGTAYFFGGIASRLAGIPLVLTNHNPRPFDGAFAAPVNRWMMRNSHVVGVSKETCEALTSWLPPKSRAVRYIPNGISLAPYQNLLPKQEARRQLNWPANALLIGLVARFIPTKGHLALLDALAHFRQKVPQAMVVMAGDGEIRPAVERRIVELGLQSNVMLLGERSDMPLILSALDMFCLPSETEGMPVTVLEAMAASLPIVASDVGGIPQLIETGVSGLLFPIAKTEMLAQLLCQIYCNPERAREMGRAARIRMEKYFSLDRVLRDYEEVYREALIS